MFIPEINFNINIDFYVPDFLKSECEKAEKVFKEKGGNSSSYITIADGIEGLTKQYICLGVFSEEQGLKLLHRYGCCW